MTDLTKLTTNEFLDLICGKAHEDIGLLEIPDYQAELRRRLTSEPTGDVAELLEKLRICLEDDSPHVGMILWRRLHLAVAALQARESEAIVLLKIMKDMHARHKDVLPNIGKVDDFLAKHGLAKLEESK